MTKVKKARLSSLVRAMHQGQEKWRKTAWKTTLARHDDELNRALKQVNLLDIWSDKLTGKDFADRLMPEIWMDAYISVHLAGYGLYKYANACLRSELETALRLIFFSSHPNEFEWWLENHQSYVKSQGYTDVWGKDFSYFEKLKQVRKFVKSQRKGSNLFKGKGSVPDIYGKLSKYVHSVVFCLQTDPESFSPVYKVGEFKKWHGNFRAIQNTVNLLLVLTFANEFKTMYRQNQCSILADGVKPSHRDKLAELLRN
jgi:hypothetical protein